MAPHPPEKRAEAFRTWCADGDRDDQKTADLCGVPRRTITDWKREEGWHEQYLSAAGPMAELAAAEGKMMLRAAVPMMAKRLIHIIGAIEPVRNLEGEPLYDEVTGKPRMRYSSMDKDAINAAKVLGLVALDDATGDMGNLAIPAAYSVQGGNTAIDMPEPNAEIDINDLRRQASAMIEATVQAVNTRVTPKGQRGRRV